MKRMRYADVGIDMKIKRVLSYYIKCRTLRLDCSFRLPALIQTAVAGSLEVGPDIGI